jgi:hypothetical protein
LLPAGFGAGVGVGFGGSSFLQAVNMEDDRIKPKSIFFIQKIFSKIEFILLKRNSQRAKNLIFYTGQKK